VVPRSLALPVVAKRTQALRTPSRLPLRQVQRVVSRYSLPSIVVLEPAFRPERLLAVRSELGNLLRSHTLRSPVMVHAPLGAL